MPFSRISFVNGGYCRQLGYFAGRKRLGPARFHAVFLLLEHKSHGIHLIDTGYSKHFLRATRPFPQRLYRWMTPVHLDGDARSTLAARGIAARDVRSIFISHFHGDHVAGLRHFDGASFVHRREAYQSLVRQSGARQVAQGFLSALLPPDFAERGVALEEDAFTPAAVPFDSFRALDYFGDGELLLVDLPGHAPGHTGFAMSTATDRFFYVADATWGMEGMLAGQRLPAPARWTQHRHATYERTQDSLRRFAATHPNWEMLACHCPRTQAHAGRH